MAELGRLARRSVNTRQTRTIFGLATSCGLRASEIRGLRLRDVKLGIATSDYDEIRHSAAVDLWAPRPGRLNRL
jgi:hypothetical protein